MAAKLAGHFRLQVRRPDGCVRADTGWFNNLITNVGLDLPPSTGNICDKCTVGTGNIPPAVTDTQLVSPVATTTTRQDFSSASDQTSDRYTFSRGTFRFSAGAAEGNLQEVGILSSSNQLFSRALILDSHGSPTTLTVTSDEVLDVTYELRCYPPLTDVSSSMTVSGVDYPITIRTAQIAQWGIRSFSASSWLYFNANAGYGSPVAYNGTIGAITGNPSGSLSHASSTSNASYTPGTYARDFTATWSLNSGNLSGGLTAFLLLPSTVSSAGAVAGGTRFQVGITSGAIPKDSTKTLALNWRFSWARRSL
jgi:hypothetical protein